VAKTKNETVEAVEVAAVVDTAPAKVDPTARFKDAADELPIVTSLGLARVKGGYLVVQVKTQGDRVVEKELVEGDPVPRAVAHESLKIAIVKRLLFPRNE
jgi:hypothetical protein